MREKLMKMIDDCSNNDLYFYWNQTGNRIDIILKDCEYNDSVLRAYDKPEVISALIKWLEDFCIHKDNSFYYFFSFEDFVVAIGYLSQEDI